MYDHTSKVLPMKSGGTLKLRAKEPLFRWWSWENSVLSFGLALIYAFLEPEEVR